MPDSLGDRMKGQYENRTRLLLPRRTYTLIRVDGKAFHTYTKNCERPYDVNLAEGLGYAAEWGCREMQGVAFAYLQSDEVSFLLTDFANEQTCAWFDGNLQKICSVSASSITAYFNEYMTLQGGRSKMALFDARVWTIPDPTEVENYFIWRQQDAERNSLWMYARSFFSHGQLHGKTAPDMHQMLHDVGVNWNDLPAAQKRGRVAEGTGGGWIIRNEIPVFTSDEGREWLRKQIPRYE